MKTYLFDEIKKKDDNTIHIFQCTNSRLRTASEIFEPHTHDFIEIVYVVSGSALQVVNDDHYEVQRGDLL